MKTIDIDIESQQPLHHDRAVVVLFTSRNGLEFTRTSDLGKERVCGFVVTTNGVIPLKQRRFLGIFKFNEMYGMMIPHTMFKDIFDLRSGMRPIHYGIIDAILTGNLRPLIMLELRMGARVKGMHSNPWIEYGDNPF